MKNFFKPLVIGLSLALAPAVFAQPFILTNLWKAAAGDPNYPFLANDNFHRSLAYNSETAHLLVASRTGGNKVYYLHPETGAILGQLQGTALISGGSGAVMNHVGAGDDGAVYVANLVVDSLTSPFKIYRWSAEDASGPVVVYSGDPFDGATGGAANARRLGDTMAVRGSAMGIELLFGTRGGTNVVLFRPSGSQTNLTPTVIPTDAPGGNAGVGLAWGAGTTFWGKLQSANLRRFSLTATNTAVTLNSVAGFAAATTGVGFDPIQNLLAVVNYTAHNVIMYDASNPAAPIPAGTNTFATANANGNAAATASFGPNILFAIDANNGIVASRVVNLNAPTPPRIVTAPVGGTILESAGFQFLVAASGSQPLSYQWYQDGAALTDATNATLTLTSALPSQSGAYRVIVTNLYGAATSSVATLTVQVPLRSDALTLLWSQAPGSQPWLTTDNTQRGLAFNKVTGSLLVVSRANSNNVAVLDATTGALRHYLNLTGVTGGDFPINLIGVGEEGVVYACNLTLNGTNAATPFKIYRWANDDAATIPEVAYSGDPGQGVNQRWGDTLDVRAQDVETGILAASRFGNLVAVFSTGNLVTFTAQTFTITNAPNGAVGLGLAWSDGMSFWGKTAGGNLYKVNLDPVNSVGTAILNFTPGQFPSSVSTLAVDVENGFLAGISLETPDNLRLYDLQAVSATRPPLWIDTEYFPTDNPNANGTGAADFGLGYLYALDSNNGLMAFSVRRPTPLTISASRSGNTLTLTYAGTLQASTNVASGFQDVSGATSPHPVDVRTKPWQFFRTRY